jgi:hypothetical protein
MTRALNMDTTTPTLRVMPKPRTAPEAKKKRMRAARRVVALESAMALQALRKQAAAGVLFLEPLEDQDVRVDRHADGQDEAGDSRKGERRLHGDQDGEGDEPVGAKGERRQRAQEPVVDEHVQDGERGADDRRLHAGADGRITEGRADRALLDDRHRHGQRPRPDQQGEVLGLPLAELAADDGVAAADPGTALDLGGHGGTGDDLLVQDDGDPACRVADGGTRRLAGERRPLPRAVAAELDLDLPLPADCAPEGGPGRSHARTRHA